MKTFRSDIFRRILPLLALVLMASALVGLMQAQEPAEPTGAKRLFYDPVTGVALSEEARKQTNQRRRVRVRPNANNTQAKYPGLHYWIELEGAGAGTVTDKHMFYTGDRIRLHMRANVDGYVAIWAFDASGSGKLIFPAAGGAATANAVKADTEFALPGFIRFAPPPENERMLIMFSRNKEDIPTSGDAPGNSNRFLAQGKKSLVFETEEKAKTEIGTYAVNRTGGPVLIDLVLQHNEPRKSQ